MSRWGQILTNFSQGIKLTVDIFLHFTDGNTEVKEVTQGQLKSGRCLNQLCLPQSLPWRETLWDLSLGFWEKIQDVKLPLF